MKKLICLVCAAFILTSCGNNKIINDNKKLNTTSEVKIIKNIKNEKIKKQVNTNKIEAKSKEKNNENTNTNTEIKKKLNKNKKFIDTTKYSKNDIPAVNLINQYIKNDLVKNNIF